MQNYLQKLIGHYEHIRTHVRNGQLMLVLDINAVLSLQALAFHTLKSYDTYHGTPFFKQLTLDNIREQTEGVEKLLAELAIPYSISLKISAWYRKNLWSVDSALFAHRPYAGIMKLIRCFQMQPHATVGIITGRTEKLRKETCMLLNEIGHAYGVHFDGQHLFMGIDDRRFDGLPRSHRALNYFSDRGYTVFGFIDNVPEKTARMHIAACQPGIMLLCADAVQTIRQTNLPLRAFCDQEFILSDLLKKNTSQHLISSFYETR